MLEKQYERRFKRCMFHIQEGLLVLLGDNHPEQDPALTSLVRDNQLEFNQLSRNARRRPLTNKEKQNYINLINQLQQDYQTVISTKLYKSLVMVKNCLQNDDKQKFPQAVESLQQHIQEHYCLANVQNIKDYNPN